MTSPPSASPVLVACVGDAESPLAWSGIPYHLIEAGRAIGFVTGGLRLDVTRLRRRRLVWNALQVLRGDRRGGYQYTADFLDRLWAAQHARLAGATLINCFQLYPPSVVARDDVDRWSFVDLSLTQLFDYYLVRSSIGVRVAGDAVARERVGYARARGVVAMSRFAADHLRDVYGVPAERLHVVVPGANLSPAAYARWEQAENEKRAEGGLVDGPLRLVMVSTQWRRKGLDRLLRAMMLARRRGLDVTLRVVGNVREDLPEALTDQPGIEWLGRINKDKDADRFLAAVADADVGCIFSRYEAGGSVLREYHALGLAAFATNAGGMPDFMFGDASVTVAPEAPDDELADQLVALGRDRERLHTLRQAAWRRRREALWESSVERLRALIGPSG